MPAEDHNSRSGAGPADTMLAANAIGKSFGETRALASASLTLRRGEAHAIVGENGSGKSTFVKIVAGILSPDQGSLMLDGELLDRRGATPRAHRNLGIATVFQEVLAVGSRSVLDNVWLGSDGDFRAKFSESDRRERAAEALAQLSDSPPPLDAFIETLNLANRQVCVIARALIQRPRVLILDESTSALDVTTRDRLFQVVRQLCEQGTSVLFTTHRMGEIQELADSATVFRNGVTIASLDRSEISTDELLRLMSGESQDAAWRRAAHRHPIGAPALTVERLTLRRDAAAMDITVHAGEIVGVGGLEGHGQDSFIRVIAGVQRPAAGRVIANCSADRELRTQSIAAAAGVVYVPRDRKTEGIFESLSLIDNFAMPTINADGRVLLSGRRRRDRFLEYMKPLDTKYGRARDRITTLSGGNQQKIVLARWLATKPKVIVLNDPTRGVDHRTKVDIYKLLEQLAAEGTAVVMLSTEVEEHLALMDRVLVFRQDALSAEIDRNVLSRNTMVAAYFGERKAEAVIA